MSRFPLASLLLALGVILVWGVSFAVTRTAVREIPPLNLALWRFVLAVIILWPLAGRQLRRIPVSRADRPALFGLGFIGVTVYFACENFGLAYTTASHAALIIATIPLFTELAAALRHRRRPQPLVLSGLLIALLGIFFIFGRNAGGGATLTGDLIMFGAVFSWVWYTFLAERLVGRYPNLVLTLWIMLIGAATLLPLALIEYAVHPFGWPTLPSWGGVAFLGIFCSALAYHYWNQAIPALGVTFTNNLLYGIPLVGVFAGVVALGEPLTLSIAAGGALVLGGVVLAGKGARKVQEER